MDWDFISDFFLEMPKDEQLLYFHLLADAKRHGDCFSCCAETICRLLDIPKEYLDDLISRGAIEKDCDCIYTVVDLK